MKRSVFSLAAVCVALAGVIAAVSAPAWAAGELAPEKAIRARQSAYYLMGQQMARINATVKGDLPFDKSAMETSAEVLDAVSRIATHYYPEGSDQGSTKAKPNVWKELPRFQQLAQASQADTAKLRAAVHAGDIKAIKAAFGATGQSCKACHDSFKAQ
jgi:cytochrome c556